MNPDLRSELAPSGTLRAGINLANFLLVTGRSPDGDPEGVAPDMAAEIARRLGVPITYVPFETPAKLADAATDDVWDIGLIGAEPARAETIAFTAAYTEIETTYLVPAGIDARRNRGRRRRRGAHRGRPRQRLRPLFEPQPRAGGAGAGERARRLLRALHRGEAGCPGGASAAPPLRRRAAARRAHPGRPVHRRPAGGGHAAGGASAEPDSCAKSSRTRRRAGSSSA